jgi:hypothetical protein
VARRLTRLRRGGFVTIAFNTESDNQGPLCLQIGLLFNFRFDPLTSRSDVPVVPSVGPTRSLIIFCKDRSGTPKYEEISDILGPLFIHPNLTIATFDCTNDLLNLERLEIQPNLERVVDCQVYGLPRGISHLNFTKVNSLSHPVECMDIEDPILEKAQRFVADGKDRPWNATFFLMMANDLPSTRMVTKVFLNYAASDIALTGLTLAEVLAEDGMVDLIASTREKLAEY